MSVRTTCDGHGRYLAGCEGCQRAWRLRHRARRALLAEQGLTLSVPAGPLRDHLQRLRAGGMSVRAIADASGVPVSTVRNIAAGRVARAFTASASRLWAVTNPTPTVPRGFVEATGTRRRMQALTAIGHSLRAQLARTGISPHCRFGIVSGASTYVTEKHAQAVADMYRDWAGKPGPSRLTVTWARKRGWASPAAWDDIDDPAAVPVFDAEPDPSYVDEEKVTRAIRGFRVPRLTDAELVSAVNRLMAAGTNFTRACDRLSVNRDRAKRLLAPDEKQEAA